MNRPPSDPPPPDSPEHVDAPPKSARRIRADLGLSKAQFKELIGAMRGMIYEEGCPVNLHADALQDAFVMASCKPISERPPVSDWDGFVSWMCTLAKYAAMTNRNTVSRRRETDERSAEEIAELLSVPPDVKDFLALEALQKACMQLEPEDRALIRAHYWEEKTITKIAKEQDHPRSTMQSRLERVLGLLRAALQPMIVAIVVLVTKNARAQGARLARHVSQLLPHATQMACAMTVAVACGVMVPASSMATTVRQDALVSLPLAPPDTTNTASTVPPVPAEVAPVKPIGLDEPGEQWSDPSMSSTKIASYIQAAAVPFLFVAASAMTQIACAGGERQTLPPQQPDDNDGYEGRGDPYENMCFNARRWGEDCPSRAEWYGEMGLCPDGTKDCQK